MTYTYAETLSDTANAAVAGMTPSFETKYATVGANIIAKTWRYPADNNLMAVRQRATSSSARSRKCR